MQKRFCIVILYFIMCSTSAANATTATDRSYAPIISYQRIGEDTLPHASLRHEQFMAQINEIKSGRYRVLPLDKIVSSLQKGKALPDRALAITFDGAHRVAMETAVPVLLEQKIPFTIFVSSAAADAGGPAHLNWDEIRALARKKEVSLGILPAAFVDLTELPPSQAQAHINRAVARYREVMGTHPTFFAWPYGIWSTELKQKIMPFGFTAAFGQQSGVAHAKSEFYALPRFVMTESFGDLDRFLITINALPLPVYDVVPEDALPHKNPPAIGFSIAQTIKDPSAVSCFISGAGKAEVKHLGHRMEIRLPEPLSDNRARINCTLPDTAATAPGEALKWRWFGMLLKLPVRDGL